MGLLIYNDHLYVNILVQYADKIGANWQYIAIEISYHLRYLIPKV